MFFLWNFRNPKQFVIIENNGIVKCAILYSYIHSPYSALRLFTFLPDKSCQSGKPKEIDRHLVAALEYCT